MSVFFLPFPVEQGRGRHSGGGLGLDSASGGGVKGRGRNGEWIPSRGSSGGGSWGLGHGHYGGATAELGGGPELGEKGKGGKGVLMRPLPWAEVKRGGGSAVAGGVRPRWWAVAALGARGGG